MLIHPYLSMLISIIDSFYYQKATWPMVSFKPIYLAKKSAGDGENNWKVAYITTLEL